MGFQGGPLEAKLGHIALKLASRRRLKTSYHQDGDLAGIREARDPFLGPSAGSGRAPGEETLEEGKIEQRIKSIILRRKRPCRQPLLGRLVWAWEGPRGGDKEEGKIDQRVKSIISSRRWAKGPANSYFLIFQ